jgi:two-component system LytT family sensor kinase
MNERLKITLYHISGWITYLMVIAMGADELDKDFMVKSVASTIPLVVVFYTCTLFIFPRYLESTRYVMLIFLLVLVCSVTVVFRVFFFYLFYPDQPLIDSILFWNQFRYNLLFAGISFAYWFALKNYQQEKISRQLQKDVSEARLTILRNQINPHFLYNTLSLLYSKTLPLSAEVAELVGKLSEMMRYSLEEAEENGVVSLEKEITHLRNFVDIHQLRFGNKLSIIFEIKGEPADWQIAPLLLITFVENAFKHGKLNDPSRPLKIVMEATKDQLDFVVENAKAGGTKEMSSGIGLVNVTNRLKLLYPDHHSLEIRDEPDFYRIKLQIREKI